MLKESLTALSLLLSPTADDTTSQRPTTPEPTLQEELIAQGYKEDVVEELFADEPANQTVINLFSSNPEKDGREGKLTQEQYNQQIGIPTLKDELPAYINKHSEALRDAYLEHDVDPRYIAAIIGIESQFGNNTGSTDVTQVYKTIYNHVPERRDLGIRQAECLVELTDEHSIEEINEMEGSYAGAMGYGQFIPCSYKELYIGDLKEMDDAIESVANYLSNNNQTYSDQDIPAQWNPAYNGQPVLTDNSEPLKHNGNYLALWSYNRSDFYISAANELATSLPYQETLQELDLLLPTHSPPTARPDNTDTSQSYRAATTQHN